MTIKVTGEDVITKSRHRPLRKVLLIISIPFAAYLLVGLLLAFAFGSFHVYGNLSEEEKASLAESALMPQIAEYIERHGLRGFQDVDNQIETRTFNSIDELVTAIPCLECYKSAGTRDGCDIKGKSAKIYEIDEVRPCNGRSSVLPLDFTSVDSAPYSTMDDWTWKYSIYEYKDGSCRFVILQIPS